MARVEAHDDGCRIADGIGAYRHAMRGRGSTSPASAGRGASTPAARSCPATTSLADDSSPATASRSTTTHREHIVVAVAQLEHDWDVPCAVGDNTATPPCATPDGQRSAPPSEQEGAVAYTHPAGA
jgi:hypothetical protein